MYPSKQAGNVYLDTTKFYVHFQNPTCTWFLFFEPMRHQSGFFLGSQEKTQHACSKNENFNVEQQFQNLFHDRNNEYSIHCKKKKCGDEYIIRNKCYSSKPQSADVCVDVRIRKLFFFLIFEIFKQQCKEFNCTLKAHNDLSL